MLINEMKSSVIQPLLSEVNFHPLSFADPNGRLFRWQGQLYRAVCEERADFYRRLFKEGIVQTLINKRLLVETEISNLALDGYELILKHRLVPFVSYPYEWCAEMLKDAAMLITELEVELAKYNLTLQDAHPWNVLFDGCHPVFVDFGSIVPSNENPQWPAYNEFCRFFIYPLQLMTNGHGRIARWLLHDYDQGVLHSELAALVNKPSLGSKAKQLSSRWVSTIKHLVPPSYRPMLKKGGALLKSTLSRTTTPSYQSRMDFMQQVRREVQVINIHPMKTEWSNYYDGEFPSFSPSENWTPKHHSVFTILSELQPNSVLDVGSNRGWYSQLAAQSGINVVAFDVDEECSGQLFGDAKEGDCSILPLVMDFRNPSPGYGLCNEWLPPATQRLKCELVMALALVHHLVFKRHLNFDLIVEGLSVFANKWLLVEFIPREDKYVREWWSEDYSWYTLENLRKTLERHYRRVRTMPSYPEPRVLLICEK